MRIYLVSEDQQVRNVCRDTFDQFLQHDWTLQIGAGYEPEPAADLYVWDVQPAQLIPADTVAGERWRHIFLVNRDDVQRFRALMPFSDVHIVLKPITRTALAAFLAEASKRCIKVTAGTGGDLSVTSLRADRDTILQCLMQTNLKLQEYDQDRTNFLARAIHDFRAPLTAITGYCGLLLGNDLGPLTEEQREVLERMQRSAKKLSRMANGMFQLSIAPRVEVSANLQEGEIRDCIERALNEIVPVAEEKQVSLAVDTAGCPGNLYFEHGKIEQVIINLLENACKFTPRGGSIGIHGYPCYWDRSLGPEQCEAATNLQHQLNAYRVDIRDNGPGIPAVHMGKIFEEYTAYGGGVDRSGGGLGLAICRMILNQHNGRIWAETTAHGAVFSFILPFETNATDTATAARPNSARMARAAAFDMSRGAF